MTPHHEPSPDVTRHTTPQVPRPSPPDTGTLSDADRLPLVNGVTGAGTGRAVTPATFHVGEYEVQEVLGRGGMGVVYRARHRTLGHEVALKMIRGSDEADRDELARFRLEAAAVARLHHTG